MRKGIVRQSALALVGLAGLLAVGIGGTAPAQARVFIGFGFGPFWGFPLAYPYPYVVPPFPYAFPYAAPPPYYAPSADYYAPPAGPGYAAQSSTWYYCDNPRGYYPYVQQCHSGWRTVAAPASMQH